MQEQAYDLSVFENREERPALRVERNKKVRHKFDFSGLKIIAAVAVICSLAWGVLYSRAQSTELTSQISTAQSDLADAKSEYDYLNLTMESQTDLETVEQYAITQLGLTKADPSQITYLTMEDADKAVKPESEVKTFLKGFSSGLLTAKEYLAP